MASASQPAASQNPKGDLDRKRATKKSCVLLGKVICFCAMEKNGDPGHVKNDWKTLRFSTIISKTIENHCVFLVFSKVFNSGRAGYLVPGGGGNVHAKPGRAREVPPEMAMNV